MGSGGEGGDDGEAGGRSSEMDEMEMRESDGTWWGRRWMAALEGLADASRRSQGRWHARSGRVVRLDVTGGVVTARLQGGQAVPRTVSIRLAPLSAAQWDRVLDGLAAEARYGAQLLAGAMPEGVERLFEKAGTSLLPRSGGGVSLACTCSEARRGLYRPQGESPTRPRRTPRTSAPAASAARPRCRVLTQIAAGGGPHRGFAVGACKHAAAVWYALGARIDADPLLLFELRGRTREEIADALRARRRAGALHEPPAPRSRTALSHSDAEGATEARDFWWGSDGGAALDALEGPPAPAPLPPR